MTIWGRVAFAMVLLAVATVGTVGLSAAYFTGGGIGLQAMLAAGAAAVLLALVLSAWIARQMSRLLAARQEAALRALAESEEKAQAIIKTALDAFFQTDQDGIILEWGPQTEALTGWTRAEALGANVVDLLVPPPLREAHRQRRRKFISEEVGAPAGIRFEASAMHRDGREFPVEVSATSIRRGDGYILNNFLRDLSQKRIAEEQLMQAKKLEAVGQLTGGIAHEFNNMLTVITGTVEMLADGVKGNPHLSAIATMIGEAADRGARLTSSLLAFARKQPLQPAEIDVNGLIAEVVQLLSLSFGRKIALVTELADDAWPALVDRAQLSSALVDLAINARDAMPDGGTLTLATSNVVFGVRDAVAAGVERAGDYVAIDVSDTGHGIPPAIRDRIFDPFFSTKEVGKGTGLGLSMVFGFVKQSGGSIELRGEHGQGATFRIYLPKADTSSLPRAYAEELPVAGGHETILCVEDDREVRAYVTLQLESLGYKVIVAADAAEALAIADRGTPFDLLFTDIVMSGSMNGRQLAERMMAGRPSLRVLLTSGYAYDAIHAQGRAGRGIPMLSKPYRKAELARMLRRCLDPAVDHAGDPIPQPYSVQPELDRFLRKTAK